MLPPSMDFQMPPLVDPIQIILASVGLVTTAETAPLPVPTGLSPLWLKFGPSLSGPAPRLRNKPLVILSPIRQKNNAFITFTAPRWGTQWNQSCQSAPQIKLERPNTWCEISQNRAFADKRNLPLCRPSPGSADSVSDCYRSNSRILNQRLTPNCKIPD